MKSPTGAQVHIFEDLAGLAGAFARELTALAARRIEEHGLFTLALAGGKTPAPLYRRLNDPEFRDRIPWGQVKIFFGDERAVPPTHPDSNFKIAWDAWLAESTIPTESIFRLEGEAEDLAAAAERYSRILTHEVPSGPSGFPSLDLILLGLGEDGHTVSLFPGTSAVNETLRVVAANDVPQLDTRRLTLTYPTINSAHEVWFLATGERKARRVAQCLGFAPGGEILPAALVHPAGGRAHWWLDRPAALLIPESKPLP